MSGASYVERKSSMAFQPTVDRLVAAIEKAGMSVFARIDHAAGARAVGLSMLPSVVLIYGQARGGTPIMQAAPMAALDLPLRALVRENERGETLVAFHPVREMLQAHGLPDELTGRLAGAQDLLFASI
jgi:uncharacterized protein (DUF302 family)